jgi:hypothetical protein
VICIADPKDEWEFAYQLFEPEEKYHLDHLRKIGKTPKGKPVKIYHPFTFNIPTNIQLPEIEFYTLNLKTIGRKEWGLIAETGWDTEVMKLLLRASQEITKEEGLFGFLHFVQRSIKGKKKGRLKKYDPRNFYLEASAGTMKSMTEIADHLHPFKKDYFLTKNNCPINIDWKTILTDRTNIHVFESVWIYDEKRKDFLVLALLEGILKNKAYLKNPILVVIPEINKLCPFRPEGHKRFLAGAIKSDLGIMRSSGRGMSSISDSQVWIDIDEEVRNKSTETFFGQLGGGTDLEKVSKAYNYRREVRDQLKNMDYGKNSFLVKGKEKEGPVTLWFSEGCHAEPEYNFIEFYRKRFPKRMTNYKDLIKKMQKLYSEEENKIRDKIRKKEKAERKRREQELREKEEGKKTSEKFEEVKEKVGIVKQEGKDKLIRLCYEMYHDENLDSTKRSYRKIGEKFGINHKTAKAYIQEYEEKLEKNLIK